MTIDGLETPVGPGSTIAAVAIVNSLKVRTAELLVERGAMPPVITRASVGRRRAIAGTCSTRPIESMRGGSPVRSTSKEVGEQHAACDPTARIRRSLHQVRPAAAGGADRRAATRQERIVASARSRCIVGVRRRCRHPARRRRPPAARRSPAAAPAPAGAVAPRPRPTRSGTRTAAASATASARSRSAPPRREALGVGQGLRAHHDPPQHGRRGPAPGHPRPDRQGRQRDRLQPERPRRPSTRPSPRPRPPASRPSRSTPTSPTRTPTTCTTTRSKYA